MAISRWLLIGWLASLALAPAYANTKVDVVFGITLEPNTLDPTTAPAAAIGEVVHMARGDSLYFDSRLGHAYISVSRQLARIVGMTIGESGHMKSAREGEERSLPVPAARKAAKPAGPVKAPKRAAKAPRKAKGGWKETQVVVRFWIITIMLVLFGLSTLKLR